MDSTHTWHPGAICVKPRWAARVDLFPDERLSSWIARAAYANGCEPGALLSALWPRGRWDRSDVNRMPGDERLRSVAREGGIDIESLRQSTLAPAASLICGGQPLPRATWAWITAFGANRRGGASASAHCPACLREGIQPYLRVPWRFAWHTVCGIHKSALVDRCAHCGRAPQSDHGPAEGGGIAHCAHGGGSLAPGALESVGPKASLELQNRADLALNTGRCLHWGEERSTFEWFSFMTTLVRGVQSAIRSPWNPWARALHGLDVDVPHRGAVLQLEHADLHGRRHILEPVSRMTALSRNELLALWMEAGVSRQNVEARALSPEHFLHSVILELPDRAKSRRRSATRRRIPEPRSRTQVALVMRRLLRSTTSENSSGGDSD